MCERERERKKERKKGLEKERDSEMVAPTLKSQWSFSRSGFIIINKINPARHLN